MSTGFRWTVSQDCQGEEVTKTQVHVLLAFKGRWLMCNYWPFILYYFLKISFIKLTLHPKSHPATVLGKHQGCSSLDVMLHAWKQPHAAFHVSAFCFIPIHLILPAAVRWWEGNGRGSSWLSHCMVEWSEILHTPSSLSVEDLRETIHMWWTLQRRF